MTNFVLFFVLLIPLTNIENLKQLSKNMYKKSHYSQLLKLFSKISSFFSDLWFGYTRCY